MEIRLRTAEEFRDAHMTIEIRGSQVEVEEVHRQLYDPQAATDTMTQNYQRAKARIDELADQLAESRELVRIRNREVNDLHGPDGPYARLLQESGRVDDLKAELSRENAARQTADRACAEIADRLVDLQVELDAARRGASSNKQWAEQAEATVTQLRRDVEIEKKRANEAVVRATRYESDRNVQRARADTKERQLVEARKAIESRTDHALKLTEKLDKIRSIVDRPEVTDAEDQVTTRISAKLATAIENIREVLSSSPSSQA